MATTERVIALEPIRVEVSIAPDGSTSSVATDARSLFDAGNQALLSGQSDRALSLFDRLIRDFPGSELAVPALYNAGLALEKKGQPDAAIDRYLGIVRRQPSGRDSRDAHIRAIALLAELSNWPRAAKLAGDFLARGDLSPSDRVEGHARRGFVLVELRDYASAESDLSGGLEIASSAKAGTVDPYFVAMSHYYLAEIPRRQFSVVAIRLPESQMTKDLNHKASLVLLANERYDRAIKTGNLYWGTAAGYQIAGMQAEFRDAIVLAPTPKYLSEQAAAVYQRRVHKETWRFLRKALRIHQKTVELANLYKTTTPWSEAAKLRAEQIAEVLARESAGELVKPGGLGEHTPVVTRATPEAYVPARVEL
ncbi:MAG: tetratricopeptide repeat protein [Deltaproteobacteria bacterium]|nr:tetratricopeptide repeat protein [Deltaproteobacteria bacterium]